MFRMGGGNRGVKNGFWRGDGGTEGGTVGIQVKEVIDIFVESVVSSGDVVRGAHLEMMG